LIFGFKQTPTFTVLRKSSVHVSQGNSQGVRRQDDAIPPKMLQHS